MNLEACLPALARISIQVGVLVLLVLLVQWLFRRHLTPRWRCALWFVVLARLVLPIAPGSAASIFNLFPHWDKPSPAPAVSVASSMTHAPAVPARPAAPLTASRPTSPPGFAPLAEPTLAAPAPRPAPSPATVRLAPASAPARSRSFLATVSWQTLLLIGWLAGVLALGTYVAACSLRLSRSCRKLPVLSDPTLLAARDDCARRLRLGRTIALVESAEVPSPALFGFFSPRLILPRGFAQQFTEQEIRFVLLHELAHWKRRDLWVNWLVTLLQTIYWFHPLLWLGFSRWRVDRELACDALALEAAGGDQSREYGRTILHLLESFTPRTTAPGLVGILEDRCQLRERIGMIARFRPGQRRGLLAIALLGLLAVIGLTDAQTPKSKPTSAAVAPAPANRSETQREERLGSDPIPEPIGASEGYRTLAVTVLDPDGQPLEGAEVIVPYISEFGRPRPRRLTDASGKFLVRYLRLPSEARRSINNFGVSAAHQNYVQHSVMWTSSAGDVYAGMPDEITLRLERGVGIGGGVTDEGGRPLEGVRVLITASGYHGYTMGGTERKTENYAEVVFNDPSAPAAVTDAQGRWTLGRYPIELRKAEITFVRPDGARVSFTTQSDRSINNRPLLSFAELQAKTATVQLPEGYTVRGQVVDEQGHPLPGVSIQDGYGFGNMVRVSETMTDASGRFERSHRAARQWIYTASRPDRATVSTVVDVQPGLPEVRIVLPPARPWRAQVTDESGQPIAGAEFVLDPYRTEGQILDWTGRTDETGHIVWTNAPTEPATYYVRTKSTAAVRKILLQAGADEQHLVLSTATANQVKLRVKTIDAETRAPVEVSSVALRTGGAGGSFHDISSPQAADFSVDVAQASLPTGFYPSFQLKMEAAGHDAFVTEDLDFAFGDRTLEVSLLRAPETRLLTVLLPDGSPAAGAKLWAQPLPDEGTLFINGPSRFFGNQMLQENADDNGQVKLPRAPDAAHVILTHASGFLLTTMAELRRQTSVQLQAGGAINGRLVVEGQPKAEVTLSIATYDSSLGRGLHVSHTAVTDRQGRFQIASLPPGRYKLYRWALPKRKETSGIPITETCQRPIDVLAGQTNEVEYAGSGRPIVGQVIPDPQELDVNWQNDVHTLSLKLPASENPQRPSWEDFATTAAFRAALSAWQHSQTVATDNRNARTYPVEIDREGSFRIPEVPPGTYELRVRVTKPRNAGTQPAFANEEELGLLVQEVVVPGGTGPLELGTLSVHLSGGAPADVTPPVALTVQRMSGKPLALAELQGRPVLLVFWASWSERSVERLAEIEKLRTQLGPDAPMTWLAVNLDETPEPAQKMAGTQESPWVQTWVDSDGRAKAAARFDINTLPAVYLLDRGGKIVGRELDHERLPISVQRALAKK